MYSIMNNNESHLAQQQSSLVKALGGTGFSSMIRLPSLSDENNAAVVDSDEEDYKFEKPILNAE